MKPFFQQVLDDRMYLWQRGPNGRLTATEFTDDGFEIGPLAQKYCTEANRKNFVSYPNTETNDELVSDDYRGLQPIGFKNDLKTLAKKSIVYRVWEGYKDAKAWAKSLFY